MNQKILVTFIRTFSWAITAFCLAYSIKNNYFLGIFVSVFIIFLEFKRLVKQITSSWKSNMKLYRRILADYYLLKFIQYSGELENDDEEFMKEFMELIEHVIFHAELLLKDAIFKKQRKERLKKIIKEVKELKELNEK